MKLQKPRGFPTASPEASLEHNIIERRPHWSWDAEAAKALRLGYRLAQAAKQKSARQRALDSL